MAQAQSLALIFFALTARVSALAEQIEQSPPLDRICSLAKSESIITRIEKTHIISERFDGFVFAIGHFTINAHVKCKSIGLPKKYLLGFVQQINYQNTWAQFSHYKYTVSFEYYPKLDANSSEEKNLPFYDINSVGYFTGDKDNEFDISFEDLPQANAAWYVQTKDNSIKSIKKEVHFNAWLVIMPEDKTKIEPLAKIDWVIDVMTNFDSSKKIGNRFKNSSVVDHSRILNVSIRQKNNFNDPVWIIPVKGLLPPIANDSAIRTEVPLGNQ